MSNITSRFTSRHIQKVAQALTLPLRMVCLPTVRLMWITAIAMAVSAFWSTASTHAQNTPIAAEQPGGSAVDRLLYSQPGMTPVTSRRDNQVVQTGFDQTPAVTSMRSESWIADERRAVADPRTAPPTRKPNFIQREKEASASDADSSTAKPKGQKFGQMIANIGMNLAFVLLVGIGFIVFSKQWFTPKTNSQNGSSEDALSRLQVKEELALDSKTTIRVIQWKDTEILVASDSEGVRAMVSLGPTFSDTLSQVETEFEDQKPERTQPQTPQASQQNAVKPASSTDSSPGIDDRLIQMLLDSANRSAASASSSKGKA